MTKEEKFDIICGEGYAEFQHTIYNEMNCESLNTEEEIIDAVREWRNLQETMERCGL